MLNPSVGSMVLISSPLNFFKIVVFPALSRPLRNLVKVKVILKLAWGVSKTNLSLGKHV